MILFLLIVALVVTAAVTIQTIMDEACNIIAARRQRYQSKETDNVRDNPQTTQKG